MTHANIGLSSTPIEDPCSAADLRFAWQPLAALMDVCCGTTKYPSHLSVLLRSNPRERVPSSGFVMGPHVADACQLCSPILPSRRRTTLAAISLVQHTLPSYCGVAARWSGGLRVMADHGLFGRGTYMGARQSNPQLPHHHHSALAASSESWHPTNTAATCHDQSGGDRKGDGIEFSGTSL